MSEVILIIAYVALIAEGVLIIFLLRSWKQERMELVKMIAAKNYPEYTAMERKDKPPPRERKSMIKEQQKKMLSRQRQDE